MPDILAKECLQCPIGSYCVGDHLIPEPCPPGFYCPAGTGYDWQPCPPGTFNSQLGLHNISCKENYILLIIFIKTNFELFHINLFESFHIFFMYSCIFLIK